MASPTKMQRIQPIFEGRMTLQAYPIETIFSEKLETVVSKGAANSRMKDFHDLFLICKEEGLLDIVKLKDDIEKTFTYRGTPKAFQFNFPVGICQPCKSCGLLIVEA